MLFYVDDFLIIAIGIVRIGIRLFGFIFIEFGVDIISFDTDRRIEDVGVSERVHGIDAWVFVLLNDDVEPPVDVDWRSKFDVVEEIVGPNDERRFVETGGLGRILVDGGRTIGTKRWVRDWLLVGGGGGGFDKGAVAGRTFDKLIFPFVCLLRKGTIRGGTLAIGTEGWNRNEERFS